MFAVRANSNFQSANSFTNSYQAQYHKINIRESVSVNCFVNFYTSESVSLRFRVQTTEQCHNILHFTLAIQQNFFYISCDVQCNCAWRRHIMTKPIMTRCSAIAERPRCSVRYSFRQKQKPGTGRQYCTDIIGLSSTTVI